MTQKYDRFKDAPWFQQGIRPSVLIGGAGGTGSWLTVLLNRAGFETFVYDHDTLEAINMAGQLYMHKSIGQAKVDALAEIVKEICQDDIIANFAKIDEHTMTNDIVFSAFDNMKARCDMFSSWLNVNKGNPKAIYIDGRLTAEQLTIFCVRGDDEKGIEEYNDIHLFPDSDVPDLPCTMAQTSHGAAMIAAHMTEFFTNWYSIVLGKDPSRNVPFFWEYIIPIGFMSTREAYNYERLNRDSIWVNNSESEQEVILPQSIEIPEGHVRLDNGNIVPLGDSRILDSDSVTVSHTMTIEQVREVYGANVIMPNDDLTLEEIKEIDDYLNEKHEVTSEETKEFEDLIREGIPNPASLNQPNNPTDSLDFEEEVNLDDDSTDPSISDLPF